MDDFNSVDEVKKICKKRKIPISRLEKDCGFSNGYIRGLREGNFPADRLLRISKYLNLSVEYLTTGNMPDYSEESAHLVSKIRNDAELSKALIKYFDLSEAKKKCVVELINLFSEVPQ